jgi:hypothetical protein
MLFAITLSRRVSTLSRHEAESLLELLRRSGIVPPAATLASRLGLQDLHDKTLLPSLTASIANDKKNSMRAESAADWVLLGKGGKVLRGSRGVYTTPVFEQEFVSAWSDFVRLYYAMQ